MKAFLIASPATGSGKTTVALGLMAALYRRGLEVQPFKVGPDFIDTGLHGLACGRPSHNLDAWLMSRDTNVGLFQRAAGPVDVAVIEGMMGLFDGLDGMSESCSTAEMAKWLDVPVIVVIDAWSLARGVAAVVRGLTQFDPAVRIAGVLLNRVAGEGHFRILSAALSTEIPVLGWFPPVPEITIPERHLGLLTAADALPGDRIQRLADFVERHIDVEGLIGRIETRSVARHEPAPVPHPSRRVAVARDAAFSFYYRANLDALATAGAEMVEFSPLVDGAMPDADLLYLGGGYPETHADRLSRNTSMRESIRRFVDGGGRTYAECGGMMYLARSIDGHPMVGAVPADVESTGRPVDFGYCEVETLRPSLLGPQGTTLRGHQFHYSRLVHPPPHPAYRLTRNGVVSNEGSFLPNGIASWVHLHFLSSQMTAANVLHSGLA